MLAWSFHPHGFSSFQRRWLQVSNQCHSFQPGLRGVKLGSAKEADSVKASPDKWFLLLCAEVTTSLLVLSSNRLSQPQVWWESRGQADAKVILVYIFLLLIYNAALSGSKVSWTLVKCLIWPKEVQGRPFVSLARWLRWNVTGSKSPLIFENKNECHQFNSLNPRLDYLPVEVTAQQDGFSLFLILPASLKIPQLEFFLLVK